jgi:class 3 adenylate cyclase
LEASDTRGGSSIQLRARWRISPPDFAIKLSVETLTDVEFVGELALKGFSRPVKAFNVCHLRSSQS